MEIFSAEQIRAWDEYTMQHEPIASIDLMERAASHCLTWLETNGYLDRSFSIYCGKGNNGGDGLALARMLAAQDCPVSVHILEFGHLGTDDFQANLERLHASGVEVRFVQGVEHFYPIPPGDVLIDALLGSGLNRKLEGITAQLVEHMNQSGNEVIAIDIPSGLFVDHSSKGNTAIRAGHTLSFQCYKPAFLVSENEPLTGEVHILDIGLHPGYLREVTGEWEWVDEELIHSIYKPRQSFANKGTYGHALLVAGSYGKMGAAVLSARSCLRAGAGLLTCHVPGCGYQILQTTVPEAMIMTDANEKINTALPGSPDGSSPAPGAAVASTPGKSPVPGASPAGSSSSLTDELNKYSVIGIGPGIGQEAPTAALLKDLFQRYRKPVVLDADGLNILSKDPALFSQLPPYSVLTPHPKEFERLFGTATDDFARLAMAVTQARTHQCIIVLKGHYTFIAMPGGKGYFNSTGNPGMAKGGSGDVLTGILTAMLSQGYSPGEATLLGVYLHGLAGDLAADTWSEESMLPSDLTDHLGAAFQSIHSSSLSS
ncbi:MAG TPA: NAD(P)H-hydrate dehydratase [Puia sp.]|jgi:NAD(P)H-hydrate epimerase